MCTLPQAQAENRTGMTLNSLDWIDETGSPIPWALCSRWTNLHLQNFPIIDLDWTSLAQKVTTKTAPPPRFWNRDQPTLLRIAIHVAEFLKSTL
jgi:hypothetical protein